MGLSLHSKEPMITMQEPEAKLRILYIGNYLYDGLESMDRYAETLAKAMVDRGHTSQIIRPIAIFGRLNPGEEGLGKWLGYIDKYLLFPLFLRFALPECDIVHICDHSNAMYCGYLSSKPYLVTCHDMLAVRSALAEFREHRIRWTGKLQQRWIIRGLRQAKEVVCVSEQTRRELARLTGRDIEELSKIENGLNHPYSEMSANDASEYLERLGIPAGVPFLFHVGSNSWYKNRLGVLKIYTRLSGRYPHPLNLVMAGPPLTKGMRDFVRGSGIAGRVLYVGKVSNEQLRALYSSASALLFPSLQEGFGWPIIEAQACGCPVFTSDRPPMNEIGGDAAIYVNPEDPDSAADVIGRSLPTIDERRECSIINAARFTTSEMISRYLAMYQSLSGTTKSCA